jgi:hypothetical protein
MERKACNKNLVDNSQDSAKNPIDAQLEYLLSTVAMVGI